MFDLSLLTRDSMLLIKTRREININFCLHKKLCREKIRGLEVRWKETNTVAERETNINVGDIIIEVNNISLFNVPASMYVCLFIFV